MKEVDYEAFFQGCHSNIEAPLIGRIYKPVCYGCKNLVWPENPFHPNTCKVFGKLPDEYWNSEEGKCPHKRTDVPLYTLDTQGNPKCKSEFTPRILIRGRKLFKDGNVVAPQQRGDAFWGIVSEAGTISWKSM